jgi:hypothetical protein
MSFSRRRFLESGSAALATLGLGGCPSDQSPRTSTGRPWGAALNAGEEAALLPAAARPDGIFEFYMFGGLCAWDTFYVVPEFGDPRAGGPRAGTMWWTYQTGPDNVTQHFERCGNAGRALYEPFGVDSAGRTVNLGPWLVALRDRPDILRRMRVMVMRHDQVPHQGGNPISLGGHRLGNPRLAGTAAHVQRFHHERTGGGRSAPFGTVLMPRGRDVEDNNADAAAAIGLHGGSARPLVLWLNDRPDFAEQLARPAFGDRVDDADALIDAYSDLYRSRLSTGSEFVRAPVLDDYLAARASARGAPDLADILPLDAMRAGAGSSCEEETEIDLTSAGLAMGSKLLLHPTQPAKYVISVDGGFQPATGGAAYDTHSVHVVESARNVTHAMRRLAATINEPGEADPEKFDLDRHTILITSEFGRTPYREGDTGLDHWPGGYVQVAIGGWVDEDRSGVVGAAGEDGWSTDWITPAEFRAATLLSLGIWPFSPEAFAVGDVRQGDTELESALWLREHVLGYRG